ncbi:hypothetical protein AVEN_265418-1, partial [Araneus ventricosus]
KICGPLDSLISTTLITWSAVWGSCLKFDSSPVMGTSRMVVAGRFWDDLDRSGEMSANAGTLKFRELTDSDLCTALTDCCRLCMHHIKWNLFFHSELFEIPKYELELSSY